MNISLELRVLATRCGEALQSWSQQKSCNVRYSQCIYLEHAWALAEPPCRTVTTPLHLCTAILVPARGTTHERTSVHWGKAPPCAMRLGCTAILVSMEKKPTSKSPNYRPMLVNKVTYLCVPSHMRSSAFPNCSLIKPEQTKNLSLEISLRKVL